LNWSSAPAAPRWLAVLGRRWVFLALAGLLVAAGIVPVLYWGGNHDVAWLLYVARRVVGGAHLYRDIVEINPPLIVLLSVPAAVLAGALGVADVTLFDVGVAALAVGAVALAARQLGRVFGAGRDAERRAVVLLCLGALFPLAVADFGQREHLLLALALPYVFLSAARAERAAVPAWEAVLVGLMAGVGLAIKPFYVPLWLLVEAYLALGRRVGPPWRRPESVALGAVLVLYPLAVLLWAPGYVALAERLGPVYAALLRQSLGAMLGSAEGVLPLLAIVVLVTTQPPDGYRGLRAVLVAALAASLLAVLLQHKGWSYHFYPTRAASLVAFGVAMLAPTLAPAVRRVPLVWVSRLAAVALALDLGMVVARRAVEAGASGRFDREVVRAQMVPLVQRYAEGSSILALTVSLVPAFPLVNYSGVGWALRFPSLWMIPALAAREGWAAQPPAARAAHRSVDERYLIDAVTEDFVRRQPALLLQYAPPWGAPDLIAYFASADPRFAAAFRVYRPVATIANYRFYARAVRRPTLAERQGAFAQPTSESPTGSPTPRAKRVSMRSSRSSTQLATGPAGPTSETGARRVNSLSRSRRAAAIGNSRPFQCDSQPSRRSALPMRSRNARVP
jgi:hypothetical protein